jgi:hypothetical protein
MDGVMFPGGFIIKIFGRRLKTKDKYLYLPGPVKVKSRRLFFSGSLCFIVYLSLIL